MEIAGALGFNASLCTFLAAAPAEAAREGCPRPSSIPPPRGSHGAASRAMVFLPARLNRRQIFLASATFREAHSVFEIKILAQ